MAGPDGEACGGCRFWDCGVGDHPVGLCRRYAPRALPGRESAAWPETGADDWCGEFAAAGNPAPAPFPAAAAVPVRDMPWSGRARNALRHLGVETLGDVAALSAFDLLAVRNCGRWTVQEIRERLATHGLALSGEAPPGSVAPWGEPGTPAPPLEPAPAPVAQSGT